jgi:hypothetical protein
MKTRNVIIVCMAALLALVAGDASFAFSSHKGTPVGPVKGTIASVNHNDDGTVNGFVVGTSLLSFSNACGGVAHLGAVGDAVTYSGTSRVNADAPLASTVSVTLFTNTTTSVVYTPAKSTTTTYASTAGKLGALNYDADGDVNGFFWTSTAPVLPTVLVIAGSEALERLALTPAAVVSVKGVARSSSCDATSPAVVTASALNGQTIHQQQEDWR